MLHLGPDPLRADWRDLVGAVVLLLVVVAIVLVWVSMPAPAPLD